MTNHDKAEGPYVVIANARERVEVFKDNENGRRSIIATFWSTGRIADARRHAEDFAAKLNAEVRKETP